MSYQAHHLSLVPEGQFGSHPSHARGIIWSRIQTSYLVSSSSIISFYWYIIDKLH